MRAVWVDTSAVVATLDEADRGHERAREAWAQLIADKTLLMTSDHVLLETMAVVQRRAGIPGLRRIATDLIGRLAIQWVDADVFEAGIAAVLAAGRRDLSVVDCVSFEMMRKRGIETAFTLDAHFAEQGFDVLPARGE